jgi:hypothetical protein
MTGLFIAARIKRASHQLGVDRADIRILASKHARGG